MRLVNFRVPSPRRQKRAVDEDELITQLTTMPVITTTEAVNSTTDSPETTSTTLAPDNTTEKEPPEAEDTARSEIIVRANVTSVPIFNLDPFVEYSIEVALF